VTIFWRLAHLELAAGNDMWRSGGLR